MKATKKEVEEAIEDLIFQFGDRIVFKGKPAISTYGLSALESAFDVLGWSDPHFIPEEGNTCEIKGCMSEIGSGMNWGDLYLSLCHKHTGMALKNSEVRPEVKEYALKRESTRDKITGFLPNKNK